MRGWAVASVDAGEGGAQAGRNAPGRSRSFIVAILAAVIVAAISLLVFPPSALAFTDVGPADWFSGAVEELSQAGVVGGYPDGTFRPYEQVNRAQFSAMLARALKVPASATAPFADIAADAWYAADVSSLYGAGIVSGVTVDLFDPEGLLTREQAVTLLTRGLKYLAQRTPAEGEEPFPYTVEQLGLQLDANEVEAWLGGYRDRGFVSAGHRPTVAAAFRAGIAGGYEDHRFYPFFNLTRAQAAGMLHRSLYLPLVFKPALPDQLSTEGYPTLEQGSSGDLVAWVESRLAALTYDRGPIDGVFDEKTATGVMAFQKVEYLERTGVCDETTLSALLQAGLPVPRYQGSGDWVEVDLDRQVLILVYRGAVVKTLPVSTGAEGMSTPTGTYHILYKSWGWEQVPLGYMYSPSYFRTSYAIHGSSSVPAWPASHGCVRTPVWATDALSEQLYIGLTVYIYY